MIGVMSYVAGVENKSNTGIIINHIEDLAIDEYNELVKYTTNHNQSMCCR